MSVLCDRKNFFEEPEASDLGYLDNILAHGLLTGRLLEFVLVAHLGVEVKDLCADLVPAFTSLLLQEGLKLLLFARSMLDEFL